MTDSCYFDGRFYSWSDDDWKPGDLDPERVEELILDRHQPTDFKCGDQETMRQYGCKKCGTKELHVARDSHYRTFARCPKCQWEILIHDG